jgi:hypothetical protein
MYCRQEFHRLNDHIQGMENRMGARLQWGTILMTKIATRLQISPDVPDLASEGGE